VKEVVLKMETDNFKPFTTVKGRGSEKTDGFMGNSGSDDVDLDSGRANNGIYNNP
jgi:hypothetical protein